MASITTNLGTLLGEFAASGRGGALLVAFGGLIAFSLGAALVGIIGEFFSLAFDVEDGEDGEVVSGGVARAGRATERAQAHAKRKVRMSKNPNVSSGELASGTTRHEEARMWDHVANSSPGASQPVWDYGTWESPDKRVFGDRD